MKDDQNLHQLILKDLLKLAEEAKFNGLEKLHYLIINFDGFTVENKMLTPTSKYVKKVIETTFRDDIERIYKRTKE